MQNAECSYLYFFKKEGYTQMSMHVLLQAKIISEIMHKKLLDFGEET